jgi:hypothetical protein
LESLVVRRFQPNGSRRNHFRQLRKTDGMKAIGMLWRGQQIVNIRSGEWASMLEGSLYLAFDQMLERMNTRDAGRLVAEQNRWLIKSELIAKAAADQFDGGTLAEEEHNVSLGKLTEERLIQMESRQAKLKSEPIPQLQLNVQTLQKIQWTPAILFMTSDEEFWEDEMTHRDKARTWHHWAEFQDMRLQVAYAFLHLHLPTADWQPLVKESQMWTEEKARLTASPENADTKDRELGRAAAKHFAQLEKQFAQLQAAAHPY